MITAALARRSTSSFPLSIGTALAFESLFDPQQARYDNEREIPPRVHLAGYQEIYINLFTLFRNLAGSLEKDAFEASHPQDLCDTLLYEIEVIENLFSVEGGGVCRPVFYMCDYKHLFKSAHRTVVFRTDKTPNQLLMKQKMLDTLIRLNKYTDTILTLDSDIRPRERTSALILTHVTWDLVSRNHFSKLDLLESHTGILKDRTKWYTKYYPMPNQDMACLPFLRRLLFIFGDRVLISPMDRKLRQLIMDTAQKRKWTQLTTDEKVLLDLGIDIKEPYVLDVIHHL